jgi:hypothetical protein
VVVALASGPATEAAAVDVVVGVMGGSGRLRAKSAPRRHTPTAATKPAAECADRDAVPTAEVADRVIGEEALAIGRARRSRVYARVRRRGRQAVVEEGGVEDVLK